MKIDDGKDALPSKLGALCSFLFFLAMVSYTSYKLYILEGKKNIDIVQAVKVNHYDNNYTFGAEQGLNVAVAVFNPFFPATLQQIDPTFGRIRFQRVEWEANSLGSATITFNELESHVCSSEELGITG